MENTRYFFVKFELIFKSGRDRKTTIEDRVYLSKNGILNYGKEVAEVFGDFWKEIKKLKKADPENEYISGLEGFNAVCEWYDSKGDFSYSKHTVINRIGLYNDFTFLTKPWEAGQVQDPPCFASWKTLNKANHDRIVQELLGHINWWVAQPGNIDNISKY